VKPDFRRKPTDESTAACVTLKRTHFEPAIITSAVNGFLCPHTTLILLSAISD
jgi:hypothetical protein